MEGQKQDTEDGFKLLSKLPESRAPRWNYVAIFAPDEKKEPQYRSCASILNNTGSTRAQQA